MLEVKIKIIGKTDEDVTTAIDQVKAKLEEGYICGHDKNDSGGYHFNLSDTEET